MIEQFVEFINWIIPEVEHTALRAVSFYARELSSLSSDAWIRFASENLRRVIRHQSEEPVFIALYGFRLTFVGSGLMPICQQFGNFEVWLTREPRFVIDETNLTYMPAGVKNQISQLNKAVWQELHETYKLEPVGNGRALVFPKSHYALASTYRGRLLS